MPVIGLPSTEKDQADFFERAAEGYATAAGRAGEIVREFRVAGTLIRLRLAGGAMIPTLVPGLACPLNGASQLLADIPCCEVLVWDAESTGVVLTAPPRPWEDFTTRGNIWGLDSARYRSAYQWGEGSVNLMDREANRAIYWVPSWRNLPAWVLSYPLRSILHWWMEQNGRQLIHGAVVGEGNHSVLIPGRGGAGKSSTALACLAHGLGFVSDDYLALTLDPEPRAYSLFSTAKLDPRSLELFPVLAGCRSVKVPGFEKAVLFLHDEFGAQLRESLPVSMVLNPRVSGLPETILGPAEQVDIERALASGTLGYLPHVGEQTVAFLGRVARELPHATLHLGTDRPGIVQAIREVLALPRPAAKTAKRDVRPYVSVLVHYRSHDLEDLKALVGCLEAQDYPRLELYLTSDPAARDIADVAAASVLSVQTHQFEERVSAAVAANRAIREAFSELLVFLSPGDRLAPTAIQNLVQASAENPEADWIAKPIVSPSPLRGALVRKSAFRKYGLFEPNPFLENEYQNAWRCNAEGNGLIGYDLDRETLQVRGTSPEGRPVVGRAELRNLRDALRAKRQQAELL